MEKLSMKKENINLISVLFALVFGPSGEKTGINLIIFYCVIRGNTSVIRCDKGIVQYMKQIIFVLRYISVRNCNVAKSFMAI